MKILEFLKKHRGKCIIAAVVVAVLILMFVGFKTLVKVGNPKYFYNYMHNTAGSLDVVCNSSAADGADRMTAYCTGETDPAAHKVVEKLRVDGQPADAVWRGEQIDFSYDFATGLAGVKGMLTFRGNYARSMTSVGNAAIESEKFTSGSWTYSTGKVLKSNGVDYWSGNGWTGQPVVVRWDDDVKATMNLFDSAEL